MYNVFNMRIRLLIVMGLMVALIAALITPRVSNAALPCTAESIRWASSSNRIYITGDVECTLSQIKALGSKSMPLVLIDPGSQIWFLGANIFLQQGAKLILHGSPVGGDVNELRLKSNNTTDVNNFVMIRADWGTIDVDSTKIVSWDEIAGGHDAEHALYKRAYINVRSRLDADGVTPRESRMDIKNSDIGYLGHNGAEAYGLSWKVLGSTSNDKTIFDSIGVYGDVVNNKIHHNYFGVYTYGAQAMTFVDNEVYESIKYGIDPHDDSDYLIIDGNYSHNNGAHGIICSQRCNNLTITNNTSSYNGGNGIMLHRNTNDSLVEHNTLYNNIDSGIAIFDSHNNTVRNNDAKYNSKGIRLSVGSSNNIVENNNFSENSKYGMYFYKGSDIPTSGDGRIKLNTFRNNTINTNGSVAAKIQQADSNIFESNEFTGNASYAAEIRDSDNNIFKKNTLTGNTSNYYYVKYDAVNTIQDSDSFAVKIGDAISTMTISDSTNAIFKNSKNLSTNAYPSHSSITLNQANASKSVVSFNRLTFTAIPSAESLTVLPLTWNNAGDFAKKWTAENAGADVITVSYLIGDLKPNTNYDVLVDGVLMGTFTTNGNGEINFDYSSVFENTKTFEVEESI